MTKSDYLGPYLLGPNDTPENGIYTGDARELSKLIPDESVDLIFTDPVYNQVDDYRWLAEMADRTLKQDKACLSFCAHHRVIECGAIMMPFLSMGPVLEHGIVGPVARLFAYSIQCNVMPCLWGTKGKPTNKWMALKSFEWITGGQRGHKWGKNAQRVTYRLEKFTDASHIVLDPFTGGGTVPAVCKMLGRRYLAFEIEPVVAEMARERVRNTQPPLFVPEPEQQEMTL